MTDRQAIEWYIRRYEKEQPVEWADKVEAELKHRKEVFNGKSLEQRKKEYWAMCAEFGCSEAEIQKQWKEYVETGSMT